MKNAWTIGNFDGVHKGHQKLIKALLEWKNAQNAPHEIRCSALSFDPHPRSFFSKNAEFSFILPLEERIERLKSYGIDEVQVIPFNKELAALSPQEFFDEILIKKCQADFISVGHNFFFGKDRKGSPETLSQFCKENSLPHKILEGVRSDDNVLISSTRIRTLLKEARISEANELLGHPFRFQAPVIHGNKRGRTLGFPTANQDCSLQKNRCMPPHGVYLTKCILPSGASHHSISNLGIRPTLEKNQQQYLLETHVLDFEGDLYGKSITVEFYDTLRSERKFGSLEELRQQIQIDTRIAREKTGL